MLLRSMHVEIMDASLKSCSGETPAIMFMPNEVIESNNPHPNLLHLASFTHCDHCIGNVLDVCLIRHLQWVHTGVSFISSTVLLKMKACRYVFVCLSFENNSQLYFNPTSIVSRKASKQHCYLSSYLHFWCFSDCWCSQASFCSICNWP